jgi:hypothetical protein
MYLRYFMWNFSGRQNDMQGHGGNLYGNWITGIKFIDELRLGPQDNLPETIAGHKFKHNKAHNTYYMLPLLLGIIGFSFHFNKHRKDFWVIFVLFFMTGLAIVLYLSQTPYQPRERDYSYVGSFLAFSIWIGLGVLGIIDWVSKKYPGGFTGILVTLLCLGLVPGIMIYENWDDHNRSGRFTSTDSACDYLNSCAPNAIIFTNGDNDTFPLWCAQEVLGVRTDVRVVNLSYLGADWYIKQMQCKVYESDPVPFSMTKDKYQAGSRDVLYIVERIKDYTPLKEVMDFVASDDPATKTLPGVSEKVDYIPAKNFSLKIDTALVLANGTVTPAFAKSIVPEMKWTLNKKNAIYKNDMMVLDLIANNNWKRPVYFAITVADENYLGLEKYFRLDGLAYRVVPVESARHYAQFGSIDSNILYDNLMNKFKWGNAADPKVYLDENNIRMLSNFRNSFASLAEQLISENKLDLAEKVLDKCFKVMPVRQVPLNYWALPLIDQYYRLNHAAVANKLVENLFDNLKQEVKYFSKLKGSMANTVESERRLSLYTLNQLGKITASHDQKDLSAKIESVLQVYMQNMEQ